MKWTFYYLIKLKVVEINISIHLKLDVYAMLNLQTSKITKKLFHQLHSDIKNLNLNFMD